MKQYIRPALQYIDLRLEDRIMSDCTGSCDEATAAAWNRTHPNGPVMVALTYST